MDTTNDIQDTSLGRASDPALEHTEILHETPPGPGDTAPPVPRPGVSTRYGLGKMLGEGGMGVVHEATDLNLNRQVAVKVIRPEYADRPDMLDRFFHEAEILGSMDHPGLLAVHERGVLPGSGPFYAMKLVRGRTLQDIVRESATDEPASGAMLSERVELFRKVCETMAYAHARGYIHRDLKPANIMIDGFGVVLVMDWGLAKRVGDESEHTLPGGVMGTPGYMSPEQAEGDTGAVDRRSDVFALGVILYELLTGERPFQGISTTAMREQIGKKNPPGPRALNKKVPRALAAICMKALSPDTARRYADAAALAEDIKRFQCHMPVTAYRRRLPDQIAAFAARRPALAAAAGTCVLVVLLAASGFTSAVAKEVMIRHQTASAISRFLEESQPMVTGLEERVLALNARLAALRPDDEASRNRLHCELAEIETARQAYADFTRVVVSSLMARSQRDLGQPMRDITPELAESLKKLRTARIDSLVAEGNLFRAHHELHMALNEPMGIEWTDEEKAELARKKDAVETQMRANEPEGFIPPNWDAYSPGSLMRRIAEESGLL
jgi:serine/threonine protein kinase